MNDQANPATSIQRFIPFWVIWFGILAGLFIISGFVKSEPVATDEAVELSLSPFGIAGIGAAVAGLVVRFLVIPRLPSLDAKLPAMVVGLALCEAAGLIGMFALPTAHASERTLLFSLAVAAILVSAPIYARRERQASPYHQA